MFTRLGSSSNSLMLARATTEKASLISNMAMSSFVSWQSSNTLLMAATGAVGKSIGASAASAKPRGGGRERRERGRGEERRGEERREREREKESRVRQRRNIRKTTTGWSILKLEQKTEHVPYKIPQQAFFLWYILSTTSWRLLLVLSPDSLKFRCCTQKTWGIYPGDETRLFTTLTNDSSKGCNIYSLDSCLCHEYEGGRSIVECAGIGCSHCSSVLLLDKGRL